MVPGSLYAVRIYIAEEVYKILIERRKISLTELVYARK